MAKVKTVAVRAPSERTEPGVYLRADGKPRWEVKIRWTGADGNTQGSRTVVFPFDPAAKPSEITSRKNALDSANHHAIEERAARRLFGKPRAELPGSWTLGTLLERLLEESRAEAARRVDAGKVVGKALEQRISYARMLTGQAHADGSRATKNKGFPDLCRINLRDLKSEHFGGGPNSLSARLLGRDGGPAPAESVRRVIGFLSQLFQRARREWGIDCGNPLEKWKVLDIAPAGQGRERTLSSTEWEKIQSALSEATESTRAAILVARFTAARRGEVVGLDWSDLSIENAYGATALLRDTKSRHKNRAGMKPRNRTIPLPPHVAVLLLGLQGKSKGVGPVFLGPTGTRLAADSVTQAWTRACKRAGVEGARLHDLRHTRISELGNLLKNPLQVAAISGHDDLGVLQRYFHVTAGDLAKLLNQLESGKAPVRPQADAYGNAVDALLALPEQEALMAVLEASKKRHAG